MIGYFTKFGDGSADILPIVELYKTQLREFAKFIGVPNNIIAKKAVQISGKGMMQKKKLAFHMKRLTLHYIA